MYMYNVFIIYSLVERYLGCFNFLAIVKMVDIYV